MSTSTKPYTHNQFWLSPSKQPYVHSRFWSNPKYTTLSTQPISIKPKYTAISTQWQWECMPNTCPPEIKSRKLASLHQCHGMHWAHESCKGWSSKLWWWCKLSYLGNDSHEEKWQLGWCFFEVHNGECGNLLQDPNYKPNLGVPITSLWSHLYNITQSRKRGKARVLQKEVEVALVEYMKMMQAIKHLITFTQLHLKVVEITQKSSTLFKNGIPRWGCLRWFKKPNLDFSLRVCKGGFAYNMNYYLLT